MMRKFPYGESNFAKVSLENYIYVDKTKYIEVMENLHSSYHFFLRPRRFGKSLFASMLSYYYGTEHKQNFENLFGRFYIGKNPTSRANSYLVLDFDFSGISTKTHETTWEGFLKKTTMGILDFLDRYAAFFPETDAAFIVNRNSPHEILGNLVYMCKKRTTKKSTLS